MVKYLHEIQELLLVCLVRHTGTTSRTGRKLGISIVFGGFFTMALSKCCHVQY